MINAVLQNFKQDIESEVEGLIFGGWCEKIRNILQYFSSLFVYAK